MTTKVPLADVLWEAANRHLLSNDWSAKSDDRASPYSCDAVLFALQAATYYRHYTAWGEVINFLIDLGCQTGSYHAFAKTAPTKRQGARYMWLLLAMFVAEDEQIMVEVE